MLCCYRYLRSYRTTDSRHPDSSLGLIYLRLHDWIRCLLCIFRKPMVIPGFISTSGKMLSVILSFSIKKSHLQFNVVINPCLTAWRARFVKGMLTSNFTTARVRLVQHIEKSLFLPSGNGWGSSCEWKKHGNESRPFTPETECDAGRISPVWKTKWIPKKSL